MIAISNDASRMRENRAANRDLEIPEIDDPSRRQQLEADDVAWLKHYFGDVFYNPFTDDQLESIAECSDALGFGYNKCRAAPRGGGKSSILKCLCMKYALHRRVRFPLIIAATFGKAKKATDSMRKRFASRSPTPKELEAVGKRGGITRGITPNWLAADYPVECFTARYVHPWPSRARNVTANGGRVVHVEWGSDYFILPTWEDTEPLGPIMMAVGYSSDELQGCNIYDQRPDAVLLDDLDSRDSLASEHGVIASKIEEAIEKTIAGLGGQSKPLGKYFICTITSTDAAAYKYSDPKLKPAWDGTRVSAIKQWPNTEGMALWEKYIWLRQSGMQAEPADKFGRAAHQLYLDNREAMDAGAVLSNPYDFQADLLPDGTQKQVSSLQRCFDYIADYGRESFDTEHQNDPPKRESLFEVKVSPYHVAGCAGDYHRKAIDGTTTAIVRAVDVRKIELHQVTLAADSTRTHRIVDYDIAPHGTSETTVEQAESLILDGLRAMADDWDSDPPADMNGAPRTTDLVLIDKGWMGNWTEDGTIKTWASQPVELFCMERGLKKYLPAKGAPNYQIPAADRDCIVGDNWHINKGKGKSRQCTEVIWNANHWHLLVEELFMLPEDDKDRFELFAQCDGVWSNHKAFGEHITVGAEQLKVQLTRGSRSRKPKFVKDHWWDSLAMALVAQSVHAQVTTRTASRKPRLTLSQMASVAREQ